MSTKNYENWAEVDLGAIRHNLQLIQKKSGLPTAAVVKANGYGHGIIPVSQAAVKAGAIFLIVARFSEAQELRDAGFTEPILVLGMIPPEHIREAAQKNIRATVFSFEQIDIYESALIRAGLHLTVHAKIDSGMGRLGVSAEDGLKLLARARDSKYFDVEGLFTHLARADEPDVETTDWQLDRFDRFLNEAEANGMRPRWVHSGNSAGALFHSRCGRYDMVRAGVAMYGMSPSPAALLSDDFIPVLSWKAGLISIKDIPGGRGVSYGHRYITREGGERIGVIPVGYADGFRRLAGNTVLVNGKRVPVVGNICMDQCMIRLDDVPNAAIGDEVILIGKQNDQSITADDLATLWGTINYEVTCGINQRVERIYS